MSTPEQLRPEDETIPRLIGPRVPVPPPAAPRGYPGSALLSGDRAKTVLRRLHDGDPLGIAQRCREHIRERALLVAEQRLYLRAIARIAYASMKYRGDPPLSMWLTARIDQALEELVTEDRECERLDPHGSQNPEERYAFLTEALGVDATTAREAAIVFNDLPTEVRQAFWALVIEGKSLNRQVAEGHGPRGALRARVKRAIVAISTLSDPGEDPKTSEAT